MAAALLFGAGTPLAKQLLTGVDPWMLAGLLYLGSGLGLGAWRMVRRAAPVRLPAGQWAWLAGAVLAGGVVGPLLLMFGMAVRAALGCSPSCRRMSRYSVSPIHRPRGVSYQASQSLGVTAGSR